MRGGVVAALVGVLVIAAAGGAYAGLKSDGGSASSGTPTPPPLATLTPAPVAASRTAAQPPATTPKPPRPRPWVARAALARDVQAVAARGAVGVALRQLGGGAVVQLGEARSGHAWSTMKVPVVLARLRLAAEIGDTANTADRSRNALTASDNAAAQSLFDDIVAAKGGLEAASEYVQAGLRAAGDDQTVVNTVVPGGGFSTFGQTDWSIAAGTLFFSALARGCLAPAERDGEITDLMGQVVADQRWGLGAAGFGNVMFKGGWGPEADGKYLVRQFGIVRARGGRGVVIALLARPADGSFAAGTEMLTALARSVAKRVRVARTPPAAACDA